MYYEWRPYVSVAARRAKALREMEKLKKKGHDIQPVRIEGKTIARTFWGKAWCDHLEKFSDYENRLPRGRTYVRNGSVCHLEVKQGEIVAKVSGSMMYNVKVRIATVPPAKWRDVKRQCAGQVGSLLELLAGKLSGNVMTVVTDRDKGLFPLPKEISLSCSCPDWAEMCKHVAAVMYGVGARLDEKPELLFLLRGVDHAELVGEAAAKAIVGKTTQGRGRRLDAAGLGDVFGIDLAADAGAEVPSPRAPKARRVTEPARAASRASKRGGRRKGT